MEPISIGMMLLGSALQAYATNQAAAKQRQMAVESQRRALASQNQATDVAMKRVQEFDPNTRKKNQDEIQTQLTDQYQKAAAAPQITAQGVQVGQTIPGGTTDYLSTKARELAKATESNRNLAALMGRIGSAGELRRNEAVGIGDTAGEIGRIGTGADNMARIDRIGINSVAPSLGMTLAGRALGAYGKGQLAMSGLESPSSIKFGAAALGDNPAAGFGLGLKAGGGLGVKSSGNWLMPQG